MEKQWQGGTAPLVDDLGDGSHVPIVKIMNPAAGGGQANALTDAQLRASPVSTKDVNGSGAVRYTTDTTAVTGTTYAQIVCLTTTTFSLFTRTGGTGSIVGIALPPGTLLIGPITAYTLTSGAVAAYV
jgi:hypothetical protein